MRKFFITIIIIYFLIAYYPKFKLGIYAIFGI